MDDPRTATLSVYQNPAAGSLYARLAAVMVDGLLVLTAAEFERVRADAAAEIGSVARGPIIAIPVAVS